MTPEQAAASLYAELAGETAPAEGAEESSKSA